MVLRAARMLSRSIRAARFPSLQWRPSRHPGSMTPKPLVSSFLLLLSLTTGLPVACESISRGLDEPHPEILPLWRSFLEMPRERALALAGHPERQWVGGAAGGYVSQLEAEEGALSQCRERRRRRRLQAPCRLYATGDEIVWVQW